MEMRCVMPRLGSASAEATAASRAHPQPGLHLRRALLAHVDGCDDSAPTSLELERSFLRTECPLRSARQSVPRHGAARRARRDRRARAASTARVARHRRPRPVAGEPRRVRDARGGGAAGVRRGELDPGLRAHRTVGRRRASSAGTDASTSTRARRTARSSPT